MGGLLIVLGVLKSEVRTDKEVTVTDTRNGDKWPVWIYRWFGIVLSTLMSVALLQDSIDERSYDPSLLAFVNIPFILCVGSTVLANDLGCQENIDIFWRQKKIKRNTHASFAMSYLAGSLISTLVFIPYFFFYLILYKLIIQTILGGLVRCTASMCKKL